MTSPAKTSTTSNVRRRLPTHRPPTHPGEMLLEEFLKPLGITQMDAAARMRVPFQRMNTLVRGKRGVTADTALQADYDLWYALKAVDLSKITPLRKSA